MENLSCNIATINGTGSLSANQLLTKILFRAGWTVGSYNFFPSNIAGLPCLYHLRLNSNSWTSFSTPVDILISLNPKSLTEDLQELKNQGLLISDEKDKVSDILNPAKELSPAASHFKGTHLTLPLSASLKEIPGLQPKTKPLLKNMIYVGLLCEWLKIENRWVQKTVEEFFQKAKGAEITEQNLQAVQIGKQLAAKHYFPFSLPEKARQKNQNEFVKGKKTSQNSKKEFLMDGNTSSALGALFSGCQFVSWYPITPATSLVENFEKLANIYQIDSKGQKKFIVLQVEDELAGISQAMGAGWAGLRSMTATSGPGLSLMSEGAGLSYWTEIPMVLCNVQRAGPSTGLPTRTQQGDLLSSCFLSHGDSKHIVLLPGTVEEAFHFTAQAFDLAEELQTLVIVLSDLDLGMNLRISHNLEWKGRLLQRGKVLREKDLKDKDFYPYGDEEEDGISYRTLPGIRHSKGAYFNRGSGHNRKAEYSERHQDYTWKLDKLERKWQTAKQWMPEPVIESFAGRKTAFVTFGPSESGVKEMKSHLEKENFKTNYMRIRSFPLAKSVEDFLNQQEEIFVVEQNREGQLKQLLGGEFPQHSYKMKSLLQYDGRPLNAHYIIERFNQLYLKNRKEKSG